MRPVRLASVQSTWDQGLESFRVSDGKDLFHLGGASTQVWPLINDDRGVETIIAELDGRVPRDQVLTILRDLQQAKLIRMAKEDFRDQVLSLYSFNRLKIRPRSPSLMSGSAGASLYFLSEGLRRNDERLLDLAREELLSALGAIQTVSGASSFYEGPMGILWLENLWAKKIGERLLKNNTLRPFLKNYLDRHRLLLPGRFDFLYGTSGWALAQGLCDGKTLRDMATLMVRQIEESLEPNAFGVGLRGVRNLERFHDPDAQLADDTSPGFLHGTAGALTALVVLRSRGVLERQHEYLVHWLTESLLSFDEKYPMPRTFERPDHSDRQDWCHGDGGIGLTFLLLARDTGKKRFQERGNDLLKRALDVFPQEEDPGLCHGLSGKLAMAVLARSMAGGFDSKIRQWLRELEHFSPELVPRVVNPLAPIIVSGIGAVISMNAVDDPEFIGFYFPVK